VLVDTGSSDQGPRLITERGLVCHHFPWRDDFAAARNYSLSLASKSHILVLDIDELILPTDLAVLRDLIGKNAADAFYLRQINLSDAFDTPGWLPLNALPGPSPFRASGFCQAFQVRLLPNLPQIRYQGLVHEQLEAALQAADMRILESAVQVFHLGWLQREADPEMNLEKAELYRRLLEELWRAEKTARAAYYYFLAIKEPSRRIGFGLKVLADFPELRRKQEIRQLLVQAAVDLEQWQRALNYASRACEDGLDSVELRTLRARCLNQTGRASAALTLLENDSGTENLPFNHYLERIRTFVLLGWKKEAAEILKLLPPGFPQAARKKLERFLGEQ